MLPAPRFVPPVVDTPLGVLYADPHLAVIVKPRELLSCPGTSTPDWDSVARRIPTLFPAARGALLAHRLDAPTSGLMVVGLTPDAHRALAAQFAAHTVSKAYQALLAGHPDPALGDHGVIDLPMRSDWRLRPRQVIDLARGRPAQTRWQIVGRTASHPRVHFEPLTGRTHQLRLHAADPRGLGTPIVGDRIYGIANAAAPDSDPRATASEAPLPALCLHASALAFTHPVSGDRLAFSSTPDF